MVGNSSRPNCMLLNLPVELQTRIFEDAAANDAPITPEQWLPGSSLFSTTTWLTYGSAIVRPNLGKNGQKPEELSALNLAATCRYLQNQVGKAGLFYCKNKFEFRSMKHLHLYLAALSGPRAYKKKWFTEITVSVDGHYIKVNDAITMLATLPMLQTLTIDITQLAVKLSDPNIRTPNANLPGFRQLRKLRGVKQFDLIHGEIVGYDNDYHFVNKVLKYRGDTNPTTEAKNRMVAEVIELEEELRCDMNNDVTSSINEYEIDDAVKSAELKDNESNGE